jgi:GDPmannose 4,6-dehydratase
MSRALITGITGQDGLYLGELLAAKGYEVFGLVRGQSNPKIGIVEQIIPSISLLEGDLRDLASLITALELSQPDEVYNLGAMSFVGLSWKQAELTGEITGMGVLRMLEAIRIHTGGDMGRVRFYQASSSEMFGKVRETPQNELTPFHPRSPYGVAKTFGHYMTVNYRESYGAYAASGILFNHESPRRGVEFVTRKITRAVARIALGLQDSLSMGNLDARRDWGFAGDYVEAMWRMLQQDEPDDFVVATGQTHTVREVLEVSFARAGIENWEPLVTQDPRFFRPAEVDLLVGDATKAREQLGWRPTVAFQDLIEMMVDADLAREKRLAASGGPHPFGHEL